VSRPASKPIGGSRFFRCQAVKVREGEGSMPLGTRVFAIAGADVSVVVAAEVQPERFQRLWAAPDL
jgi:hypothetical protein